MVYHAPHTDKVSEAAIKAGQKQEQERKRLLTSGLATFGSFGSLNESNVHSPKVIEKTPSGLHV